MGVSKGRRVVKSTLSGTCNRIANIFSFRRRLKISLTLFINISILMMLLNRNMYAKLERNPSQQKCALLFFGLVKAFEHHVYPSVVENILNINPQCDVYLHTYNITSIPVNKRNSETNMAPLNISEALVLTSRDRIIFETEESFHDKRDDIINRTRVNYHHGWGDCCLSHDNMIKQWSSIQGVWDLMRQHEIQFITAAEKTMATQEKAIPTSNKGEKDHDDQNTNKHYYGQIGLFRSDVMYTNPIDIFDANAATANFARHGGYNDRLFYGKYEYAKIWASQRFDFIDTFEKKYMTKLRFFKDGYHSETFVKRLMDHHKVPVRLKDICTWRIRSGPKVQVSDCRDLKEFSTFDRIDKYVPKQYVKGGRTPNIFLELVT